MTGLNKKRSLKREKTLLTSLLLSAPGPIATGIPAILSLSATQIADFIRRTAELAALFVSWWVYRKLQKNPMCDDSYRTSMERRANLTVTWAMICSGIAMLVVGVARLFVYDATGDVAIGLAIAVSGLLVNSWFWFRYRSMTKEQFDPVIESQQKLYQAKAYVDSVIVIALTSVTIAPDHPATKYIDAGGCIMVACYLFYKGLSIWRRDKNTEASASKDLIKLN